MLNLQQTGIFELARLLLSVSSIFLLTKVSFSYTLLLSKGCFLLLGRGIDIYDWHYQKHRDWSIPISWRGREPLQLGPAVVIPLRQSHHRRSIIDAILDAHCSQVHPFYALERSYRSQQQDVKKLLLHLGFSLAKNYH